MTTRAVLALAAALLLAGCGRKVITPEQRTQAANMVSEAEFAMSVKEYSRAEGLYIQATSLCPDSGDTWVSLGVSRMRLANHSGAKDAFKSAVSAYKDAYAKDPADSQNVVRLAYVLVVLGRQDEARAAIDKAHKDHPDDRLLSKFVEEGAMDKVIADPGLKEITP